MERNNHIDEFSEFLREKADQYKMYPSDKVWNNIQRSVHPRKKWPYISLTLLVLLGTAVLIDYNTRNSLSINNVLTFGSTTFKNTNTSPLTGESRFTSEVAVSPVTNEDRNYKGNTEREFLSAPVVKHTARRVNVVPASNDNADNSYAEYDDREVEGSDNIPGQINAKPGTNRVFNRVVDEDKEEQKVNKVLWGGEAFKKSKLEWQLFFSPTVGYRRLSSNISEVTDVFTGEPYAITQKKTSVNHLVTHKPAIGAEVGANAIYKLSNNFRLKAGLQLKYSRYQLSAFAAKPEMTTLAVVPGSSGADSINVISTLQNFSGSGSSWLNNEYFQVSLPVGFEWSVLGGSVLNWNVAGSAQPVYNFANNVYLLSTDFKRYGQDPSLVRKWNINAGVETYISYNIGSFKWQAGPQLRYQLLSSYKKEYPVKEYLVDFGFKIGVTKTIR